jgi:hypothetical protein
MDLMLNIGRRHNYTGPGYGSVAEIPQYDKEHFVNIGELRD